MKIGMSTTDFQQAPADRLFGEISGIGFVSVQIGLAKLSESEFAPDGVHEIPETISRALISAVCSARRYGLDIAAINGTFNMSHPDKAARGEGVRRFGLLAEAAGEIGCKTITLCTGTRNTARLWAYSPENTSPGAWSDMMDTMRALVEIAERYELTLVMETEASNVVDTPEKAKRALDEIGSERLAMIMDCANLFRAGEAMRNLADARISEAFRLYGGKVALAHGKDIRESEGIEFCAAGEGIVNFDLFLSLLKKFGYAGDMILHGVYDTTKMPAALEFMHSKMENIGL